jgi:hypothetical protein
MPNLQVIAEAIPQWGIAPVFPGTPNPFCIAVCVTNPDGTPVIGLTKDNFNVFQISGSLVGVQVDRVELPIYLGSEGFYALDVSPNGIWEKGYYYTFGVVVSVSTVDGDVATTSSGRVVIKLSIGGQVTEPQVWRK